MERHFALPVTFAAAAHAALLFGFSKPPRPPSPPVEKIWVFGPPPTPPAPELPEPEEETAGAREPKPEIAAPVVRSVEPPPLDPGIQPTMTVPPLAPFSGGDAPVIPLDPWAPGSGTGQGPGAGVLPRDLLDNSPRTRFQASPVYPFEGKQLGLRGEVLVEFVVDEQGRVLAPRVLNSSHRMFEEPTLRAVAKWVFEPGRRDGRVVRFRMSVPVVFTLND